MYALLEVVGSFLLGRRPVHSFSKYELRHLKTPYIYCRHNDK